jgi:hypothetical protein
MSAGDLTALSTESLGSVRAISHHTSLDACGFEMALLFAPPGCGVFRRVPRRGGRGRERLFLGLSSRNFRRCAGGP